MNRDTTEGKFDQVKGKIKQGVGEALGNEKLADQVKGSAQEAWGNAKEAAHTMSNDAQAHAQAKGHDVREKITSTAQNVKNAVSEKAAEVKRDHKRTA